MTALFILMRPFAQHKDTLGAKTSVTQIVFSYTGQLAMRVNYVFDLLTLMILNDFHTIF